MTLSDIQPHAARGSPPFEQQARSATHAVSVHRHASSRELAAPRACAECDFRAPAVAEVPSAILAVPDQWARILHSRAAESVFIDAARLRDELHVIANRIARVLAAPGSAILAAVRIDTPTAWTRPTSAEQLIALLRLAAERLAEIVNSLRPQDWRLTGRVGRTSMSVRDLTLMALHRSHSRLTRGRTCR